MNNHTNKINEQIENDEFDGEINDNDLVPEK